MAFVDFDMTAGTSGTPTVADGGALKYGTLFGTSGYWLRLPSSAPPIAYIPTGTGARGSGGVYVATTGTVPYSGVGVAAFARGTRFIRLAAKSTKTRVRVHYTGMNEGGVGPTA